MFPSVPESTVYLHVRGEKGDAVPAITGVMDRLLEMGHQPAMRDPAAVAAGDGWVMVEVRDTGDEDARAIVRDVVAQVPGADEVMTVADPPASEV